VAVITGHSGEAWRDKPPGSPDFRLSPEESFAPACLRLAQTRSIRRFAAPAAAEPPWGVIVAAGKRRATVEAFAEKIRRQHGGLLKGARITLVDAVVPGFGTRPRVTAQVRAGSRNEALAMCQRLRSAGAFCTVNRN